MSDPAASESLTRGTVLPGGERLDKERDGCDTVVIGSGAAGAVIAAELAEAGQDVVVLEEGPHVPPERYSAMRPSQTMRHMWRDAGLTFAIGLGDTPMINVMMGRCFGGSSVLTGGVCFRVPGSVLHEWRERFGLADFTEANMLPCAEAVERTLNVQTVPVEMRSKSTRLFLEGAEKLGIPSKPLRRNTRDCDGCGRCNFGCPHGRKLSVDVTYLPRALAAGARVYTDCKVERITSHAGRASGVRARFMSPGRAKALGSLEVRAKRVVLAAGAYASPVLLMNSGFRSAEVGKNLTLHPGFRVMARFDEPVRGWQGALQSAYSDALEDDRITLVGLFVPPGVLAATLPGIGPEHARRAASIPYLSVFGGMLHDAAGGRVHRRFGQPFMTYRLGPADHAAVPKLMRTMAEIYFAAGAREVFLPVLGLGGIDADALRSLDLAAIPKRMLECSSQHPLGTCRMGTSPETSVVDPDGQAWELPGLYIADGSIVPTSLGVNPQLSIMTLAMRIAWKLREQPFLS
ncbi:MAG TPA: GMC family oxidoreductase [Polyangiaceae bacterium]|nr:GMC family oxidoreductase [Polyangiaceae bacterium]